MASLQILQKRAKDISAGEIRSSVDRHIMHGYNTRSLRMNIED